MQTLQLSTQPSLNRRHVADYQVFERADLESFELMFEFLQAKGGFVARQGGRLARRMPAISKALWRPDFLEIENLSRGRSVHGRAVIHQAMHLLVVTRFGPRLKGKPSLTLLAEGLASAIEFYFELKYLASGGDLTELVELRHIEESSRILKRGYVRKLNQLLADPFLAFVRYAQLLHETSLELAALIKAPGAEFKQKSDLLARRLRNDDHYIFLYHKDFTNFVLYAATYCGLVSSSEDKRDTSKCLALLNDSASMPEFLQKLMV